MGFLFLCIFSTLILGPAIGSAAVDVSSTSKVQFPEQILDKKLSPKEMNDFLPEGIALEQDASTALRRMADRGLQVWWNSPAVQSAKVARTTDRAEKKMRADVTVRDASAVDHRFQVTVQALQGLIRMRYLGLTNLELRYQAGMSQTSFEWTERIWTNKNLVVGHYIKPSERLSSVGLRWQF